MNWPDQSAATVRDALDEVSSLRQELDAMRTERDEARAELANTEKRRERTRRMLEATRGEELAELRTAACHVVDCYRHGNLMGVIVGVDKLAELVDP